MLRSSYLSSAYKRLELKKRSMVVKTCTMAFALSKGEKISLCVRRLEAQATFELSLFFHVVLTNLNFCFCFCFVLFVFFVVVFFLFFFFFFLGGGCSLFIHLFNLALKGLGWGERIVIRGMRGEGVSKEARDRSECKGGDIRNVGHVDQILRIGRKRNG